jgi:hypothetical protein
MLEGDALVTVAEADGRVVGICDVTRAANGSEKVSFLGWLGINSQERI